MANDGHGSLGTTLVGAAVTLALAIVSAAYSSHLEQRLDIQAERREAYTGFVGDVRACLTPDRDLVDRLSKAATEGMAPDSSAANQLRVEFAADVIQCTPRVETGAARVRLLARNNRVADLASDASELALTNRGLFYEVTLALLTNDTATIVSSIERLGSGTTRLKGTLGAFEKGGQR